MTAVCLGAEDPQSCVKRDIVVNVQNSQRVKVDTSERARIVNILAKKLYVNVDVLNGLNVVLF